MDKATKDPWHSSAWDFQITGARVVATLGYNRGAIVENVQTLHCTEGRLYTMEGREEAYLHQLEYYFGFSGHDEAEPYPSKSVEARIIVTGRHSNGFQVELRGDGWIGYDDHGFVTGRFDNPPVFITEDCYPEQDASEEREDDGPVPTAESLNFPMPPQFTRATVSVPEDYDIDD